MPSAAYFVPTESAVASSRRPGPTSSYGRALYELNIDILCADISRAKGRVERTNLALQDRLVKELRLRAISTISRRR